MFLRKLDEAMMQAESQLEYLASQFSSNIILTIEREEKSGMENSPAYTGRTINTDFTRVDGLNGEVEQAEVLLANFTAELLATLDR